MLKTKSSNKEHSQVLANICYFNNLNQDSTSSLLFSSVNNFHIIWSVDKVTAHVLSYECFNKYSIKI